MTLEFPNAFERHIYIEWKIARIEADMEGRDYCIYCPCEFAS